MLLLVVSDITLWALWDLQYIGARDRAMLLFVTLTAFCGESACIFQWSDLFVSEIPMDDISPEFRVPVSFFTSSLELAILTACSSKVLAALADNAKYNKDGCVDEHGALCNQRVELCPVGALGMMFFAYFNIPCQPVPRYEPEFANPNYSEYGHCSWYECYVFSGEKTDKQMSYDSMCSSPAALHQCSLQTTFD